MGVLPTKDGFINIGVGGEGQWHNLCAALERADLATHTDFATQDQRFANRPKLKAVLDPIFERETSDYWLKRLEEFNVPAGPIYRMNEVFDDPQVRHLALAQPVMHPVRGEIRLIGEPVTLSRTPASLVAPIPDKGEHTDDILSEAGFDHETIAKLKAERVV
jgi:crotonobetainyl-CoA:carnitine CoA-transferase CaiB-like acyl-CoA transferase